MRVADYIAEYIYDMGVHHVFMVSGGGMMYLSDGLAKHPKIRAICTHHEQAAGMAAESYAKYNNNLGVTYVTTGCGGTNAVTPLLGAWQDSIPCMFISGQCKRKETIKSTTVKLRQFGVQEADIISIVQSLTKYAVMVSDPNEIKYHLDKAVFLAKKGRPGPVWLDIPMDIQSSMIDKTKLVGFPENELDLDYKEDVNKDELLKFIKYLEQAKRPVIVAGHGIYLANAREELVRLVEKFQIPVVCPRLGINNLPFDHKLYVGIIGNKGDRAGNLAVQNADLLLVLGSRLSVSSIGHQYEFFGRESKKVVVDIDPEEHKKNTIKIDQYINSDVKCFINKLLNIKTVKVNTYNEWSDRCIEWKTRYPVCLPEHENDKYGINLYYFVDQLSKKMPSDAVIVTDSGSTSYVVPQAIKLKKDQFYITSSAQGEMGYALPGAIGVSFARDIGEVICVTGDGSFQMNIQELQTIVHNRLPIKIFIWNNNGYLSIRATQEKFFQSRYIGSNLNSGVSFPSLKKIAKAYGIKYIRVDKSKDLDKVFKKVFSLNEPVICDVICDEKQLIAPTVSSYLKEDGSLVSMPIEDMYPFLPRKEFLENMIVSPLKESIELKDD